MSSLPEGNIVILDKFEPSITQQHMANDCDINQIMEKALFTGETEAMKKNMLEGDFTSVPDFEEAQNIVANANTLFSSLNASIRAKFDHSYVKLLEFIQDDANYEEAVKIGLIDRKVIEGKPIIGAAPIVNNEGKIDSSVVPTA